MPSRPNVLFTQVSKVEFKEKLLTLEATTVKFEEWQRIEITLPEEKSTTLIRQIHVEILFRELVRRVTTQYQQIGKLNEERVNDVCNHSNVLCGKLCMQHEHRNSICLTGPPTGNTPTNGGALEVSGQPRTETQVLYGCIGRLKFQQRSSVCLNQT